MPTVLTSPAPTRASVGDPPPDPLRGNPADPTVVALAAAIRAAGVGVRPPGR